jgi:hypothetical protein
MLKSAPTYRIQSMQNVLTLNSAKPIAAGQWMAEIPGAPVHLGLQLHLLAPGHTAQWPSGDSDMLLIVFDGLGKAAFDGAAQRIAAPCVLRQSAGTQLRIVNQGSTPMRVMNVRPAAFDAENETRNLNPNLEGESNAPTCHLA